MIEWKKFNGRTAPEELSEDNWLILVNGRIVEATHNAMEKCFYVSHEDYEVIYAYHTITHYAEANWPEDNTKKVDFGAVGTESLNKFIEKLEHLKRG